MDAWYTPMDAWYSPMDAWFSPMDARVPVFPLAKQAHTALPWGKELSHFHSIQ